MLKINILSIGKTKHPWLISALAEYTKRLTSTATIKWVLVKNLHELEAAVLKESSPISLDPRGLSCTSPEFAALIHKEMVKQGSRLTFVIGSDEGLSEAIKNHSSCLLSLSPLTFTHQMTRLILIEQLYRAFEIQKGSPYHKY